MRRALRLAAAALAVALGGAVSAWAAEGSIEDPAGDTYNEFTPPQDLLRFDACADGDDLRLTLVFANPIHPAGSGTEDEVVGLVDLDVDQSAETGRAPFVDDNSPYETGLGTDFFIDLGDGVDLESSTALLWDAAETDPQPVPLRARPSALTVRVPLSLLGGDDGLVGTAAVAGPPSGPTDAVPNGGNLASAACPPRIAGDANCDGTPTAADLPAMAQAVGTQVPSLCEGEDADGDDAVAAADVDVLLSLLFGDAG